MTRIRHTHRIAFSLLTLSLLGTTSAYAQATRTWVSGVGDDVNPCSRTAPCKTFAGALSKTAAAGEIAVLDPGGYGAVTITKSITLNGDGTLASILASGTNGIVVNGAGVVVTVRNVSLIGALTGLSGVRVVNAGAVILDRVTISGFTTAGVEAVSGNVTVVNSTITQNNTAGMTSRGVWANSVAGSAPSIAVEGSTFANNDVAVEVTTGAIVRLSNNGFYNNKTAFFCNGSGQLASTGNNRKANNNGGVVAAPCAPNAAITVQ
jgi:hypothetical protein